MVILAFCCGSKRIIPFDIFVFAEDRRWWWLPTPTRLPATINLPTPTGISAAARISADANLPTTTRIPTPTRLPATGISTTSNGGSANAGTAYGFIHI
jgi:hypothetical protein